jgi:hypothetical protein
MDTYTPPALYGNEIEAGDYNPLRSVVQEPEVTISGNIVLRAGREHWVYGPQGIVKIPREIGGWRQTEHIVLMPDEAVAFAMSILEAAHTATVRTSVESVA